MFNELHPFLQQLLEARGRRIVGWSGNLGRLERSRHLKPRQLDSSNRVGAERNFQALFALSRAIFRVKSRYMCDLKATDH